MNPAAFNRAPTSSAALVVLPSGSAVLIAISSRKMSLAVPMDCGCAEEACVAIAMQRTSAASRRVISRDYSESNGEKTYVG